jgi:hypothetical protein
MPALVGVSTFFFIFENEKSSASGFISVWIPWEGPLVQGCPHSKGIALLLHFPMETVHKIRRLTKKASPRNILKEAMRVKSQIHRYGRRYFKYFVPGYFYMVCLGNCSVTTNQSGKKVGPLHIPKLLCSPHCKTLRLEKFSKCIWRPT